MLFWSERTTLLAVHPPLLLPLLLPFPTWERGFWAGWPLVSLPLLQEVEQHSLLLAGDGIPPFPSALHTYPLGPVLGLLQQAVQERSRGVLQPALQWTSSSWVWSSAWVLESKKMSWVQTEGGGPLAKQTIVVQSLQLHQPLFWVSTVVSLVEGWEAFTARSARSSPRSLPAKTSDKFFVVETWNRPHLTLLLHTLTFLLGNSLDQLCSHGRACSYSRGLLPWADPLLGS